MVKYWENPGGYKGHWTLESAFKKLTLECTHLLTYPALKERAVIKYHIRVFTNTKFTTKLEFLTI